MSETKIRYKRPSKRSKNYVPPAIWDNAIAFCRCYPIWLAELIVCDTSKTITNYTQPKVQTSGEYNPVETMVIRREKLRKKVDIIENAANETTDSELLRKFLIMGVTHQLSYDTLDKQGIPCGRRMYHELRREMIYRVSQEI